MLKQLVLQKRLDAAREALRCHLEKESELRTRRNAFETREQELVTAVEEITTESTDEERAAVESAVAEHGAEGEALSQAEGEFEAEKTRLTDAVTAIENELQELEQRTAEAGKIKKEPTKNERKVDNSMENRTVFFGMTMEQRDRFLAHDEVKSFLGSVRRSIVQRDVNGGNLVVPDIMLDVLRSGIYEYSRLLKHIRLRPVKGKARQTIIGDVPEGIWMEATGKLNELDLSLNQIEVDGYLIGGYIPVSNITLEDGSDIALAQEIMTALAQAIGKGIDHAIPFGTGIKMPLGFISRLRQTEKPSNWGENAPEWKDLHESHILKLNIAALSGESFFAQLITALGVASPRASDGKAFWIMNRKTHMDIISRALAFNASGALVAGMQNTMPIIGGDIIEIDDDGIGDYEIAGGFGSLYLMTERDAATVSSSEHTRFIENQTVFKGYARYDGQPVRAEAFMMVSYDNTDAQTSSEFPFDYANTTLGELTVTSAAGTSSGKTAVTVSGNAGSGTTLAYRVASQPVSVETGNRAAGFTAWNGTDEIAAASGKFITVVELDSDKRIIQSGCAVVVAD